MTLVNNQADTSSSMWYNGWRWLVERIGTEPEASKQEPSEYDRGYEAGYRACRDRAIRLLSSKGEHDYE